MAQTPPGQGGEKRKKLSLSLSGLSLKGKYMDIEFDFKGSPLGGVITNCMCLPNSTHLSSTCLTWPISANLFL